MEDNEAIKLFSVETEAPEFISTTSHQIVAFALYNLDHEQEILTLSQRVKDLDSQAVIHIVIVNKEIEEVEQFAEENDVRAYWSGAREMRCQICTKYVISQLPCYVIFEDGSPDFIGYGTQDLVSLINSKLNSEDPSDDDAPEPAAARQVAGGHCDPRPRLSLNPSKSYPELHNEEAFLLELGSAPARELITVEPLRMKRWAKLLDEKNRRIKQLENQLKINPQSTANPGR